MTLGVESRWSDAKTNGTIVFELAWDVVADSGVSHIPVRWCFLRLTTVARRKPFTMTDPKSGTVYSYDLSAAKAAGVTQLIGGYEGGTNTWTMFLNICGNAAITTPKTCKNPTPVCQVDGSSAYDCGGAGAQNLNWAVGPYYAPGNQGTLLYDQVGHFQRCLLCLV